ncbi:hypothetical protein [Thalassotalea euphylliae]|uniref:PEP-CTERM sorting domain-containing protein n=1 Tax=Thalassotalea euphylliae TaxID=1655234 RepID=A0A3E0UEJ2_9GAMM|nr:hypothetical protein [Thalassotalea euphylliae]REL35114.1 hypothetical protein DXX92_06945 [Thalassotalea euphylliae]
MKTQAFLLGLWCVICALTATSASATLIGRDLSNQASVGLISYQNAFTDAFGSSSDGTQIYRRGAGSIPLVFLDDSLASANDSLGIIKAADTAPFFGLVDTTNPDNLSGDVNAIWQFDINGFNQLSLAIDIAAMGDFEPSDIFSIEYQLDGGAWQLMLSGTADNAGQQTYQLENGNTTTLDDPMAVSGVNLTNSFTSFSQMIVNTGSTLGIRISANTNGGTEAIAFRNITVNGTALSASPVEVPEPSYLAAGILLLMSVSRIRQLKP